ncbi:MAG: hypothetical protein ACERKD_12770 [Prolixibacteraceae bacterium]
MLKKIFISLAIIVAFLLLFMGGCVGLSKYIFSCKGCQQFNIDNTELRTGIDIPSVNSVDCNSDGHIKVSTFVIDTSSLNMKEYISTNRFKFTDGLYRKSGENVKTKWEASLNALSAELTVKIEYLQ